MSQVASQDSESRAQREIAVVSPLYNDWDSYRRLAEDIDRTIQDPALRLHLFAIDDGSTESAVVPDGGLKFSGPVSRVEIIGLALNMGHQRAIAVGLAEVLRRGRYSAVAVMDADGEDRPEDLARLIRCHLDDPERIVVAARARRSEGRLFRSFYAAYKALFRVLVGAGVDFGNFCIIPASMLERITYDSNTWNHLAAAIIRSKIPLHRMDTSRGSRYFGRSRMSLEPFVIHGLSAISVFTSTVFVRLILAFAILAGLASLGILAVVCVRLFFSELAIPGWATSTAGLLLVIVVQSLFFSAIAAFTLLNQRAGPILIPATDALKYIKSREVVYPDDAS